MTNFLSSADLINIVKSFKHEDLLKVREELDNGVYTFFKVDYLALRQQDYIVVTSDGCLFKIKIYFGTKYDVPNYDDFAVAIAQYRKTHGKKPTIYGDLAKELKCKTYIKMVELEEITKKNGYWLNKQKLREILKGAYKKGVISLDTMLDKMEMFD